MSGVLKAVGKAFKSVVKVVKKVALPALAIGAVVLTGGAALGVLPSIGALGSSLGLSAGLTGILSTAAQGATFGALGSLLTGGNPLKGATKGFMLGGVMGGIGALGAAPAAQTATSGLQGAAQSGGAAAAGGTAASAGSAMQSGAQALSVNSAAAGLGSGGIGSAMTPAVAAITPSVAQGVAMAPSVAAVPSAGGGGLLGFLNRNPMLASGLIQGIGSGLVASEQAKEVRKQREAIAANYGDMSGLFQLPDGYAADGQPAASRYDPAVYGKVKYDPNTGRVVAGA